MYLNPANETVRKRQKLEIRIVTRVVKDALAAGYVLDVDNGGDELEVTGATTLKATLAALMNTDDEYLILRHPEGRGGWIRLVYGNDGWDVICDYSGVDHIEAVLAGANALAEKLEERA
jgi:hypothetical protein